MASSISRSAGPGDTRSTPEGTLADRVTGLLAADIRSLVYPADTRLPTELSMTEHYGGAVRRRR